MIIIRRLQLFLRRLHTHYKCLRPNELEHAWLHGVISSWRSNTKGYVLHDKQLISATSVFGTSSCMAQCGIVLDV